MRFTPEKIAEAVLDLCQQDRSIDVEDVEKVVREFCGDSCLAHCRPDEPIFVLCARDLIAPQIVHAWADRLAGYSGADQAKVDGARAIASEMEQWPGDKKLPGKTTAQREWHD